MKVSLVYLVCLVYLVLKFQHSPYPQPLRLTFSMGLLKRESDPKRRALVDDTLHSDSPAMFLDDTLHDRET